MQRWLEVKDNLPRLSDLECRRELSEKLAEKLARKYINIGEEVVLHQSQRILTGGRDASPTIHDDF